MLSYLNNIQCVAGRIHWYNMIETITLNEKASLSDQFVGACCRYLTENDTSLLKETTHLFVEQTIIGNKDVQTLLNVFGTVYPFIKMILFDDSLEIHDQKNELLVLMKFFVKTGYFDTGMGGFAKIFENFFSVFLVVKSNFFLTKMPNQKKCFFPTFFQSIHFFCEIFGHF